MVLTPSALPAVNTAVTAAVACTAAVWDIRSRRIPNWLSLPALVVALLLHLLASGWHALATAAVAAMIAGGIFFALFLAGGMGGGDVKLIAAVAAGVGLTNVGALLVFTSLTGGAMALVLALRHGRLRTTLWAMRDLAVHHGQQGFSPHPEWNVQNPRTLRLPYAVAIAAGVLLTLSLQGVQR